MLKVTIEPTASHVLLHASWGGSGWGAVAGTGGGAEVAQDFCLQSGHFPAIVRARMDVEACDTQLGAALQAGDAAGLVAALTRSLRQKSNAFPVLRQTLKQQLLLQVWPAAGRRQDKQGRIHG